MMDFPFADVPNFSIEDVEIKRKIKCSSKLKSVKFIKVILHNLDQFSKYEFETLGTLVQFSEKDEKSTYNFVDFQLDDDSSFFMLININKVPKTIDLLPALNPLPHRWKIFFNSTDNIVVDDPFCYDGRGRTRLLNNKYYSNVDYFVGIASLIATIKNAGKVHFDNIIPSLNKANETLSELAYSKGLDINSTNLFEQTEKDYLKI